MPVRIAVTSSKDALRATVLKEIAKTDNAIQDLCSQRYKLNETLNTTAPIMKVLNLDILVEIFTVAIKDQFQECAVGAGRLPFLLATICKSWRRILLDTPKLWSYIFVQYDSRPEIRHLPLLETWLSRSCNAYLHITFAHMQGACPNPRKGFELLSTASSRWRSFDTFYFPHLILADLPPFSFPHLESLALRTMPKFSYPVLRPITLFQASPIRQLQLTDFVASNIDIDFSRVKSLSGRWEPIELRRILDHVPQLESCDVIVNTSPAVTTGVTVDPSNVVLEHLKILEIRVQGFFSQHLSSIFSCLTAPQLDYFRFYEEFQSFSRSVINWSGPVSQMLERSACQLETLWLVPNNDTSGIMDVFRKVPSTQHLVLQSHNQGLFNNMLVEALATLPNLDTLTMEGTISFDPNVLTRFIRGRQSLSPLAPSEKELSPVAHKSLTDVSVKYPNYKWGTTFHPNLLRDFYKDMLDIERNGTTFTFDCVDKSDF